MGILGKSVAGSVGQVFTPVPITRTANKMADKKKPTLSFFESFMLSGVAAGVSKTAAAPIERVKLLVQNQNEMLKQGVLDKPYNGVLDCTRRTMAGEGLVSFWRGNLANVLRCFPTQALNFAFKDTIKAVFNTPKNAGYVEKFGKNILSGGVAGSMSLTFVYSLDYARTRLANDRKSKDGGERKFNGLIDVYRKTLKSDGIQGLYRGFVISWVGIVVYRGFIDCGMQIIKAEGFMSLMKGAGANILRGVAGAGVLAGFDKFKEVYIAWRVGGK